MVFFKDFIQAEIDIFLIITCNEYVQMIWHNHVRADPCNGPSFPKRRNVPWIAGVARMLRRFCAQAVTKQIGDCTKTNRAD
jgi:hypothetical protein